MITIKRIYEKAEVSDGKRFLIERLWPRGIRKTALKYDAWIKEAGPSHELRRWFSHDPAKWTEFQRKYFVELDSRAEALKPVTLAASEGPVTLLYSSHDTEHNNAVALKKYLEGRMRRAGRRAA